MAAFNAIKCLLQSVNKVDDVMLKDELLAKITLVEGEMITMSECLSAAGNGGVCASGIVYDPPA